MRFKGIVVRFHNVLFAAVDIMKFLICSLKSFNVDVISMMCIYSVVMMVAALYAQTIHSLSLLTSILDPRK